MARLWHTVFTDLFSHRHLWLFPLLGGLSWFTTLTILLVRWLSLGRPRYPGQVSPDVPFVSDIAAQTLQPVFIAGTALTGFGFLGTVFAVHHVRYSPHFYGRLHENADAQWRQIISFIALVFGLGAACCLTLLAVFDTYHFNVTHRYLLMGTFGGLSVSALLTTAVWWDQVRGTVVFVGLRKWCLVNTLLVFCQFVVGASFVGLLYSGYYHPAGILEWCLTYSGSLWMLTFVGYTRFREGEKAGLESDAERQPLLA